jgi:catechol 2,3-dioxygenase-like lactoylglutathione lyase family enzyme
MTITIKDIAYVRYQAPDLHQMESFLVDFGLHTVLLHERALYMRAAGSLPVAHITELGEIASLGFGLLAESVEDLQRLACEFGVAVESNQEPGGGQVVHLNDPDGFRVSVHYGLHQVAALPSRKPLPLNGFAQLSRLNAAQRLSKGPSTVMRLGHLVLKVGSYSLSSEFYARIFGMRASDTYYAGSEGNTIMAFMRCGLGQQFTDHHTLGILEHQHPGSFDHSAFEVLDWDDLMLGNQHLQNAGYAHSWGVGRHLQGSQVFDYWRDPFGNKIEHWTDGDRVNDDYLVGHAAINPDALAQWGPPLNPEFMS